MAHGNCKIKLIMNHDLSQNTQLFVLQGFPLSARFSSLYLKPFRLSVARDAFVRGFRVHSTEVKAWAYAEDVALLGSDIKVVPRLVQLTKDVCDASGVALNGSKTSGFLYGSWDFARDSQEEIHLRCEHYDYLGVLIQRQVNSSSYWAKTSARLEKTASRWEDRQVFSISQERVFATRSCWPKFSMFYISFTIPLRIFSKGIISWRKLFGCLKANHGGYTTFLRSVKGRSFDLTHLFLFQRSSQFLFLRNQNQDFLRTEIYAKFVAG